MGHVFWNTAIGPFSDGERSNLDRGYAIIAYDADRLRAECAAMVAAIEQRIAERARNRLLPENSDLDPEQQEALDRYYRSEHNKLKWLERGLQAVSDMATQVARDPDHSPIKVVSIR